MAKKQLPEDFKEFIKYLNSNKVKYLLLGGWAVGIYGQPRVTKDIDFLIAKDKNNLNRLKKALNEFGSPPVNLDAFKVDGFVIRMGSSPVLIDIINKADGIDISDCYDRRKIIKIDDIDVSIISLEDLIINKRASGRGQDVVDAEKLERTALYKKNQNSNNKKNNSNNESGRKKVAGEK